MKKAKYITHCLNSSPSKQTHKFGTSNRFEMRKSYGEFKYDPQQPKTKIAPSFGYGNKGEYVGQSRTPSPDKYRVKSQFDNKAKGFTFGRSPSALKKTKQNAERTPDYSGKYLKTRPQQNRNKSFKSTHQKLKSHLMNISTTIDKKYGQKQLRRSVTPSKINPPGPGAYNVFSQFGPLNYYR